MKHRRARLGAKAKYLAAERMRLGKSTARMLMPAEISQFSEGIERIFSGVSPHGAKIAL